MFRAYDYVQTVALYQSLRLYYIFRKRNKYSTDYLVMKTLTPQKTWHSKNVNGKIIVYNELYRVCLQTAVTYFEVLLPNMHEMPEGNHETPE
jgi:hypothetical protein